MSGGYLSLGVGKTKEQGNRRKKTMSRHNDILSWLAFNIDSIQRGDRRCEVSLTAMKVVLLAGGLGTRLSEETQLRPKPMVEIGGKPILWHIMKIYGAAGFNEFIVALGYKGEIIKHYFLNFYAMNNDLTVDLKTGDAKIRHRQAEDWTISLVDTGDHTQTGGRIRRLRDWIGDETFMATYGDGVGDVDLKGLLAFHEAHGKLATVTAVHPPSRFGDLILDGDRITQFSEKPQTHDGVISGGFFVFSPKVLDYIDGDATALEREPMTRLTAEGELMAFRHEGFWQPMDTLREKRHLEDLWDSGKAPWMVW